MLLSDATAL